MAIDHLHTLAELPTIKTSFPHDAEMHSSKQDSWEDVLIAKAVTMVVLCSVSTIMGIVPMFLAKWFKWDVSGQSPR
jgi:hypothetical protein